MCQLAEHADLYVNDAFGCAHRAHASTEGVTHYLQPCVAGLLMQKVSAYLSTLLLSSTQMQLLMLFVRLLLINHLMSLMLCTPPI